MAAEVGTTTATVEELLTQLTLEEKVLLLEGVDSWNTNAVERLGIPALFVTDGPHGVRKVRTNSGAFGLTDTEHSTAFPTSATIANSWDPENARRVGAAIGHESAAMDVDVLLAPGINIKRNPLCGRNFEYFSEDPLVSGVFGSAFVQGVQSTGVGTSVKHFAANSNENYRFVGDSLVDERALREIYLPAFHRVVTEAQPATVMCAYNALNGVFCSDNRELLTGILREEWGFEGIVMTDWGAMHDRIASINAGCELDMPGQVVHNREQIIAGVRDGRIAPDVLDEAVRRMLRFIERAAGARGVRETVDAAANARLASEVAADGAVLLSNDGTLPLVPGAGGLVVVGEMFEKMRFQGAGSSLVNPPEVLSPKDAFARRDISYRYARGYRTLAEGRDLALEAAALEAARDADTVLFFGGLGDLEESEGFDRTSMALGEAQQTLLRALLDAGVKVVLVLFAGAPVELPFVDELAAVLDMYLPGMHGGEAAAALLFGETNPSGKLTESWPLTAADASSAADYDKARAARYYESIYVGYRFYDKAGTRLRFPFGHGLSYTQFAYHDLAFSVEDGQVRVSARLENTGERDGAEIVQLYVRNNRGGTFKADKELRAFTKVVVPAGQSVPVSLTFALSDLSYWDVSAHDWVLDNGDYEILLAASATDIRLHAPLRIETGRAPRSPYASAVEADYARPPRSVPASFPGLLGRPVPAQRRARRLELESRLVDARGSLLGRIMYAAVIGRMQRDYRRALALPDSLERDTRVKNTHFLVRMMPFNSLRSMVMSSGGAMPYHVAAGLEQIAAGHLIRGVRQISGRKAAADTVRE